MSIIYICIHEQGSFPEYTALESGFELLRLNPRSARLRTVGAINGPWLQLASNKHILLSSVSVVRKFLVESFIRLLTQVLRRWRLLLCDHLLRTQLIRPDDDFLLVNC